MKVAMIVSAIVFTQTSILNFSYFLNNVIRILQYDLKIGNFLWFYRRSQLCDSKLKYIRISKYFCTHLKIDGL